MNLDAPLLYMFSIDWLAWSLFLAHTSVACDQIWLINEIWYDAMNLTLSDEVLGIFYLKKNSLTSSSLMIYSYQSHMVFTLENLIHMLLVITLSFVKLF
jgi:hypothetical protein